MDIKDLRYFVAVYDTLNFSRAAIRLHTVQSHVSSRIRALEKYLRIALFERFPVVSATPSARLLYRQARRIIAAMETLERTARRRAKRPL